MNTCDTCKWWGIEPYRFIYSGYDGFEICGCDAVNEWDGENTRPDSVRLHKSIDTSIVTGPKFGCVHHEPKP